MADKPAELTTDLGRIDNMALSTLATIAIAMSGEAPRWSKWLLGIIEAEGSRRMTRPGAVVAPARPPTINPLAWTNGEIASAIGPMLCATFSMKDEAAELCREALTLVLAVASDRLQQAA